MASLTSLDIIPYDRDRQGIYVDLDSLYDTRLACLEEVNVELAFHAIRTGWSERVFDTLPGFPDEEYKRLYEARDVATLMKAHPTMVGDYMKFWIEAAKKQIQSMPYGGSIEIYLNVWPYKLTKAKATKIGEALKEVVGEKVSVMLLNIDPVEITALDAKRYFSCMFMSDYYKWLDTRSATCFRVCPIPDVVLYVPKILRGTIDDDARNRYKDVDVFLQAEQALAPMIGLEFLELEVFSSPVTADILFNKPLEEEKTA